MTAEHVDSRPIAEIGHKSEILLGTLLDRFELESPEMIHLAHYIPHIHWASSTILVHEGDLADYVRCWAAQERVIDMPKWVLEDLPLASGFFRWAEDQSQPVYIPATSTLGGPYRIRNATLTPLPTSRGDFPGHWREKKRAWGDNVRL